MQPISSSSLQHLFRFSTSFYSLHQTPPASKNTTQITLFFELKLGNLKLAQDWQHYAAVRTHRHIKLPVNTEHLMFLLKNKAHQQQGAWHLPGTELTPRVGCMWETTRRKKLTGQVFYLVLNTSGDFPSLSESSTGSAAAFGVSPARIHLARGAPNCLKGCSSQCTK